MIGTCRHCGQQQEVMNAVTQQEANDMASRNCGCEEAEKEANYYIASDELDKLTGVAAEESGFEHVDASTAEFLDNILQTVCYGILKSASINTGKSTFTFKGKADGGVSVSRKKPISIKFEV